MHWLVTVVLCFCLVCDSHQKSTPEADSYVAAVLEYQFTRNTTINLNNYLKYIKEAADQDADIVVFPEMTLTRGSNVKVPIHGLLKEHRVPALYPNLFDEILVSMSSAARQHEIYVVVNIQEEMDCADAPGEYCPKRKRYIFNTNVVFDRTGAVIDRYRKINLFGEYTRQPALQPELGLFSTDFGVTFGHFICFDLMFQVPATQVVQKHNVTDIVFSTMWFSEMPFLTAIQIQEAYAYTMNINFLAAGANNVKVATAGSGIYSGQNGALISIISGEPITKLLVARVPKIPGQAKYKYPGPIYDDPTKPEALQLNNDLSLPNQPSRLLQNGFQEFTLTEEGVSCRFRIKINQQLPENGKTVPKFRAFVKDGSNTYAARKVGVTFCAVVACRDDSPLHCPYRYKQDEMYTTFEELEITMNTYNNQHNSSLECDNVIYYPVSMRNNKFPLAPQDFTFTKTTKKTVNGFTEVENGVDENQNGVDKNENGINENENGGRAELIYKLTAPQEDLVSFAVWGRLYLRDVHQKKDVSQEDLDKYIEIENIIYSHSANSTD